MLDGLKLKKRHKWLLIQLVVVGLYFVLLYIGEKGTASTILGLISYFCYCFLLGFFIDILLVRLNKKFGRLSLKVYSEEHYEHQQSYITRLMQIRSQTAEEIKSRGFMKSEVHEVHLRAVDEMIAKVLQEMKDYDDYYDLNKGGAG